MAMKIFGLYDVEGIEVQEAGLKRVVNLSPKLILKTHGRNRQEFAKTKINIIERLINILQVPGSRGKKHKIITRWNTGKYSKNAKIVIGALNMVEAKTKQNPVAVLVKAIENAAPRDEVTAIEYGGATYPQAVDVSPIRRVNLVLRFLVHGAYDKAFNKKATITEALAKEIILASENSSESFAIQKKNDAEKQADAAR
ncbi:MAG: 30S ribosomal protein S7 [Nanoarchaeota archaeon]|nr:30S ribosomal protein S7 [Nanoarchaeota archaeon]